MSGVEGRRLSGKIQPFVAHPMTDSDELIRVEARWPVMLTSVAVLVMLAFLPTRIRAFPGWVPYLMIIMLNVPMVALALTANKRRWLGIERVLLFSLAYWRTDRGGPEARLNRPHTKPDWIFPHEDDTSVPETLPTFVDYLFLAYWTATAFSP